MFIDRITPDVIADADACNARLRAQLGAVGGRGPAASGDTMRGAVARAINSGCTAPEQVQQHTKLTREQIRKAVSALRVVGLLEPSRGPGHPCKYRLTDAGRKYVAMRGAQ